MSRTIMLTEIERALIADALKARCYAYRVMVTAGPTTESRKKAETTHRRMEWLVAVVDNSGVDIDVHAPLNGYLEPLPPRP